MDKKPRLGQWIYYRTNCAIYKDKVRFKNNEEFLLCSQLSTYYIDSYRRPISYDSYGDRWFFKLKEVKAYLNKHHKKIISGSKDYWEYGNK